MELHVIEKYRFEELSSEAQQKVINNERYSLLDYDWFSHTIEEWKNILSMIGFVSPSIYFRGFSSQGDGACFIGQYYYKAGGLKRIKEEFPKYDGLIGIVEELQDIQRRNFYTISGKLVKTDHLYNHEYTVIFSEDWNDRHVSDYYYQEILNQFRNLMRLIYNDLEREYDYLSSDTNIGEMLQVNEYWFDKEGNII